MTYSTHIYCSCFFIVDLVGKYNKPHGSYGLETYRFFSKKKLTSMSRCISYCITVNVVMFQLVILVYLSSTPWQK